MRTLHVIVGIALGLLVGCGTDDSSTSKDGSADTHAPPASPTPSASPSPAVSAPSGAAPSPSSPSSRTKPYTAVLDAAQETPPVNAAPSTSTATGTATLTFDEATSKLTGTITYSGLSGPAIAAHIHLGACGVAGEVEQTLGDALSSPITVDLTLDPSDGAALASGQLYINVHTEAFADGEIRGQIQAAGAPACAPPSPSSMDAGS